jgi:hypothetical protein
VVLFSLEFSLCSHVHFVGVVSVICDLVASMCVCVSTVTNFDIITNFRTYRAHSLCNTTTKNNNLRSWSCMLHYDPLWPDILLNLNENVK